MPIFDVYLARTYRVRMEAEDEATAERLAEEVVVEVKDASTPGQQTDGKFKVAEIETVDNHAFDAILVDEV